MSSDDDPLEDIYERFGLSRPAPRPPRARKGELAKALRGSGLDSPTPHPLTPAGPKLKVLREASGWTVEEIADRTGVPLDILAAFEQGDSDAAEDLTVADVEHLAEACCGSLSDVLSPEARSEAKRKEMRRKEAKRGFDPFGF